MKYAVRHTTTYTYDDAVSDSLGVAYLVPRTLPWQQVASYDVSVTPTPVDSSSDEGVDMGGMAMAAAVPIPAPGKKQQPARGTAGGPSIHLLLGFYLLIDCKF